MSRELKIFSGNANPALAHEICAYLGTKLGEATVSSFSDGEIRVKIEENVRGARRLRRAVELPAGQRLPYGVVDYYRCAQTLLGESHHRGHPVFRLCRQDRKDQPRVPISAKLVADLISTAGTDRVLTMDLHAGQIQGFFNVPVDHLYALPCCWITLRRKR